MRRKPSHADLLFSALLLREALGKDIERDRVIGPADVQRTQARIYNEQRRRGDRIRIRTDRSPEYLAGMVELICSM